MTESKHTPGPWKWVQFNEVFGARRFIVQDRKLKVYPEVVAEVLHGFSTCNLIATAPDLLDSLIDLIDCEPHLLAMTITRAREAIAKAQGK